MDSSCADRTAPLMPTPAAPQRVIPSACTGAKLQPHSMTTVAPEKIKAASELAWIANAFAEGAVRLVETQENEPLKDYYASRVPMFLCHHAIELTLKAAILAMGVEPPKTHSLQVLTELCSTVCPIVSIPIPEFLSFGLTFEGDLFGPQFAKTFFSELNLHFRYPTSKAMESQIEMAMTREDFLDQLQTSRRQLFQVLNPLFWNSNDFHAQRF